MVHSAIEAVVEKRGRTWPIVNPLAFSLRRYYVAVYYFTRGVFSHTLIYCLIFSADADQLVLCTSADKTLLDILVMSKQREWKGCKLSTRGLSLSRVSFALLSSFSSLSSSELSSATKAMKRIENTVYGLQWLEWRRRNRKNAKKRKIEKRHLRHWHNIIYKYSSPFYFRL